MVVSNNYKHKFDLCNLTFLLLNFSLTFEWGSGVSVGNITSFTVSKMSYIREDSNLTTWTAEKDTPIRRLTKDLLWLYDPNVRPVLNFSAALNVTHFFLLQQVIYLDSKEQKLKAFFFEVWIWVDEYLTWEPEDFGNITRITLMRENLWLPDIVVFNQVGENSNYYMRENIIPATVEHSGSIRLDTPQKYETTCLIEIENFPFDIQTCIIIVGSWSQSADTILMSNLSSNMDSLSYIENSEWDLMSTSCVSDIFVYEGSTDRYSEIHYTIVLKRRLAFYNRNLIIPMILISFMAQLVFLLPPESGEKISLAITVFLALSLNMLVISEYIPANSLQTPIASKYCLFSMFLVCLSLWLSVLVLNLQGSESASYLYGSKPSKRVMRFAQLIGPWLLVGGGPKKKPLSPRSFPTRSAMKHYSNHEVTHVFIPNHVSFENYSELHKDCATSDVTSGEGYPNDSRSKVGSRLASRMSGCSCHCNNQLCENGGTASNRNTVYYSLGDSLNEHQSMPRLDPGSNFHQSQTSNHVPHSKAKSHHPPDNLEKVLESFVNRLELIQNSHLAKSELSESTREMLEQWGYLARVVDRFFAAVYFLVNVLCLLPFIPFYAGWEDKI